MYNLGKMSNAIDEPFDQELDSPPTRELLRISDSIEDMMKSYRILYIEYSEILKKTLARLKRTGDRNNHKGKKFYYNQFKTLVENNGGKCIGGLDDYNIAITPILVECKNEHQWYLSPNNAQQGKWCPKCKIHAGELIALGSCMHLFDKPFIKIRPQLA